MIVKFDSLNRFEKPIFYVCNPGCVYNQNTGVLTNAIGALSNTTDEELILNFNATSELNFRIYRVDREDPDEQEYVYNLYKSLQNRRLIFIEDIGFFVITDITSGCEDKTYYKDVRAESCEAEISWKMIPYIADGTYPFLSQGDNIGILETIVAALPLWTIGHVDSAVASKYRTFEDVSTETSSYEFMINDMQDAYECIFIFDTIKRQIHVYDQNNYVIGTDIHLTNDDLIDSIEITEGAESVFTAISVFGDEDLNIAAVNPLGTNVIYNFDYYLDWMTPALASKVQSWSDSIASIEDDYIEKNKTYYDLLDESNEYQYEIDRIDGQIEIYTRCRENIVASSKYSEEETTTSLTTIAGTKYVINSYNTLIEEYGGETIDVEKYDGETTDIMDAISDTLSEIDNLIESAKQKRSTTSGQKVVVDEQLSSVSSEITKMHESVAIDTYFTSSEYDELYYYIYEGSYTDSYITVTDIMTNAEKLEQKELLYNRAVAQLKRISKPTQEFSIDVENFVFEKNFAHWSEQLETGCTINVELDRNDIAALFLATITINWCDAKLELTFGNRLNRLDPKAMFDDVLGDVRRTANTIDYIKDMIYPIKAGELDAVKTALENSRLLTMSAALTSTNQQVTIDETGYTGRSLDENGEYEDEQIKITGSSIVFTEDSWDTCSTAIGKIYLDDGSSVYGVNAKAIIGDLILGSELKIISGGVDISESVSAASKAVVKSTVEYYRSSSSSSLTGGSWSSETPSYASGKYIWVRTKFDYADGTSEYSEPACVTGATGATGNGISSSVTQYALGMSKTTAPTSGWQTTIPEITTSQYLWSRIAVTYTGGTTVYVNEYCISGATAESMTAILPTLSFDSDGLSINLGGETTFKVDPDGKLSATGAVISGTLESSIITGSIIDAGNFYSGKIWLDNNQWMHGGLAGKEKEDYVAGESPYTEYVALIGINYKNIIGVGSDAVPLELNASGEITSNSSITFEENDNWLYGTTTVGDREPLIGINRRDYITVGSTDLSLQFNGERAFFEGGVVLKGTFTPYYTPDAPKNARYLDWVKIVGQDGNPYWALCGFEDPHDVTATTE